MKIKNKISRQKGFSLVEMMVSVVLGLLVVLAAASIYTASRITMNNTQGISEIQENAQVAFEMMSRDIREAGGNSCSSNTEIGSTLNSLHTQWWAQWEDGIKGFEAGTNAPGTTNGTNETNRILTTDALDLYSSFEGETNIVTKMPDSSANIEVDTSANFSVGEIVLICDSEAAFIFQITQIQGSGTKLQHNSGSGSPGNCAKPFNYVTTCTNSVPGHLFGTGGVVAKVSSYRWYIGANSEGGRSLYRASLSNYTTGNTPTQNETIEMARGVTDMNIEYFPLGGSTYLDASSVTNWKQIVAVKVTLTFESQIGNNNTLDRQLTYVTALRNRV